MKRFISFIAMVSNNLVMLCNNLRILGYGFTNKYKKIQCLNIRPNEITFGPSYHFTIEAVLGKFQFQNAPVVSTKIKNIVDFTVGITLRTHDTTQISSLQRLLIFLSQWLSQAKLQKVFNTCQISRKFNYIAVSCPLTRYIDSLVLSVTKRIRRSFDLLLLMITCWRKNTYTVS